METKYTQQAVKALVTEEKDQKVATIKVFMGVTELRNNSAEEDIEGTPCSVREACRQLAVIVNKEPGMDIKPGTLEIRYRLGRWLHNQDNAGFIPYLSYSRHVNCMHAGDTLKDLAKHPNKYTEKTGTNSGCNVLHSEIKNTVTHIRACATTAKRMSVRTVTDAQLADDDEDYAKAQELRALSIEYKDIHRRYLQANTRYEALHSSD